MKFELNSLEVTKILAQFNKRNIKLTLDHPNDVNLVLNDIFPIFIQAQGRIHQEQYNSKCYELDCTRMKKSGVVGFYQYALMVMLADKTHLYNIQQVHELMPYFSVLKQLPVVDMNGMFGIDLSADEKYLNGYYYGVTPYSINDVSVDQQLQIFKDAKVCKIWHDYLLSYSANNKQIYLSYLSFDNRKILARLGYSVMIRDFIKSPRLKYKKMQNIVDFFQNQDELHDLEFEECGLQVSSSLLESQHFGLELSPCPREKYRDRAQYIDFMDNYFTKLIEYDLMDDKQKDFILTHPDTIENKDGILKFRWENPETFALKWYNIQRRNAGGLTGA